MTQSALCVPSGRAVDAARTDGYYLSNLEDPREFLASLNIMNHALIPILLTGFHLSLGPHPNQGLSEAMELEAVQEFNAEMPELMDEDESAVFVASVRAGNM